jgi:hypothetical protein
MALFTSRVRPGNVLLAILVGGLVAGTLDIWMASVASGAPIPSVVKFIAGGLVGLKAAMAGGTEMLVLGVVLQNLMGLIIAAVYVLASLKLPVLRRRWLSLGLAYGALIYFVMNYVVLPLSAIGRTAAFEPVSFAKNMIAMLVFGVIVSAASRLVDRRR